MNARAVKVCTKTVNKRRPEPKIRVFVQIFNKAVSERKTLIVQREFGKIIDVIRRKLCCLRVYMGNPR